MEAKRKKNNNNNREQQQHDRLHLLSLVPLARNVVIHIARALHTCRPPSIALSLWLLARRSAMGARSRVTLSGPADLTPLTVCGAHFFARSNPLQARRRRRKPNPTSYLNKPLVRPPARSLWPRLSRVNYWIAFGRLLLFKLSRLRPAEAH